MSKTVPDILQAVLGGNDGCILSYGGSGMGKTYTMVMDNGIMPSTIVWLYQAVNHLRMNNAVKFSIRVSAAVVDAAGKSISDALASCANGININFYYQRAAEFILFCFRIRDLPECSSPTGLSVYSG